jgi:ectoine hydroxylase-related dioxygenase (phytanoyl-CoA dioxygenase family)
LFNFKTVHGSTANNTSKSRRAFSMRFIGDDIKYIDRGGPTSPPFDGINLKNWRCNERGLVSKSF